MFKEFKEFAVKGNAIDLAIGVVLGAAFTNIVNAIVENLINPLIGALTAGVDFSTAQATVQGVTFTYGNVITATVNFIIVAFVLFLMVKQINRLKRPAPEAEAKPAEPTEEVKLLREIRDQLRKA